MASLLMLGCPTDQQDDLQNATNQSNQTIQYECTKDSDCKIGGCSGQLCIPKDESGITTCEWKEEYACYKLTECKCINHSCSWKSTPEFEQCMEEAERQKLIECPETEPLGHHEVAECEAAGGEVVNEYDSDGCLVASYCEPLSPTPCNYQARCGENQACEITGNIKTATGACVDIEFQETPGETRECGRYDRKRCPIGWVCDSPSLTSAGECRKLANQTEALSYCAQMQYFKCAGGVQCIYNATYPEVAGYCPPPGAQAPGETDQQEEQVPISPQGVQVHYCPAERYEICTAEYDPVCALAYARDYTYWQEYPNACEACSVDSNAIYYIEGEC